MKKVKLGVFVTKKEYLQDVEGSKDPVKKGMELKYSQLMLDILNVTPSDGFDLLAMQKRLKVIDVIEEAVAKEAKSVSFEDADFDLIKKLVGEHKFAILDQGIVDFIQHLNEVAEKE